MFSAIAISLLVIFYLRRLALWQRRTRGRPLPPGPRSFPLIGNMFSMPISRIWLGYRELCSKYGNIVHMNVLGQSIVILGSEDVIFEYLEKRSANTSDRKQTPILEIAGLDTLFAFMPYGQGWRRCRRAFWQQFYPSALPEYRPAQLTTAHKLLSKLLKDSEGCEGHIRYMFATLLMKIVYDIDVADENDKHIAMMEDAVSAGSAALVPGKWLVELLPFLRHAPAWFPGSGSQPFFEECRRLFYTLENVPFEHTRSLVEQGGSHSIVGKLLSELGNSGNLSQEEFAKEEKVAKLVGTVAFEAGTDTTYATLVAIVVALSLHPRVLKAAQAQLDAVVGPHRLPVFADQDSLVYITAIIKEALRWHVVLPCSLPHCTTEDDEFGGYFIPAGTVLMPNTWACMHDPAVYDNPEEFRPERFIHDGKLDTTVRDPFAFTFGYGRRICPGRYFAQDTLFITVASLLHVFDIGPPFDEHGLPIKIVPQMSDGLLSHVTECRCTIKPRSAEAEALIRANAYSVS